MDLCLHNYIIELKVKISLSQKLAFDLKNTTNFFFPDQKGRNSTKRLTYLMPVLWATSYKNHPAR